MGLILGDDRRQFGQFGDLMPGRLGIAGVRFGGQCLVAAAAGRGNIGDDVVDAILWQSLPVVSAMPGLPAGLAARGRLGDGLGGIGRIGRRGDRGVGGVALELNLKFVESRLQGGDPLESGVQERTQSRTLGTAGIGGLNRIAHEPQPYEKSDQSQGD